MTGDSPGSYYQWLDFNAPMTGATADRLVAQLAAERPRTMLDIGCGWAELLLRLLVACPYATGIGIDNDDALIDRAVGNAESRGLASRVSFADVVGERQPSDLVLNIGAEHVFGTLDDALTELRALVRPGGRLLLGTQFWERTPPADVLEFIGELPTLEELLEATVAVGFRPLGLTVSTPEDWDEFEFGFMRDWEQYVLNSSDRAGVERARDAADRHRAGYLRRRGVLGFAYVTLGRPRWS